MSRIEKALKKASQMRGQGKAEPTRQHDATPAQEQSAAPAPTSAPTPSPTEKVIPQEVTDRVRDQHMLVSMNDIISPAAEEFRKLKQNLVRLTKREGFHNTILITSATASEGKSVTATNLAISLAQEFDHTVLLVDADLRNPSCDKLLCMETEYGLSDCLLEGSDIGKAIVRTGIGKLSFLPAGTPMANPGELLASQRMANVFTEMKERYSDRYVIIDTPPVLLFAETRTLARLSDLVVLVVKEGRLSKYELGETVESLSGANLAGIVYNQASKGASSNRYLGYSKYQYYYNYQS